MPVVPPSDWLKAQQLIEKGVFKCSFKKPNKPTYVVPSSHVLGHIPTTLHTPKEKQFFLSVSLPPPLLR